MNLSSHNFYLKEYLKHVLLLFTFLATISANAQTPKASGVKLFAGSLYDYGLSITTDSFKNYYFTGSFQSSIFSQNLQLSLDCKEETVSVTAGFTAFVLRFDSSKKLNLTINNPQGFLSKAVVDKVGNIYVSGTYEYGASRDAFLSKYSSSGNLRWTRLIQSFFGGFKGSETITDIDISKTGKLVICGFSDGDDVTFFDRSITGPINFIAQLNTEGEIEWITNFSSELGRGIYRVKFDKDENIVGSGNEALSDAYNAVVIIKLNGENGNAIWKKQFIPGSRSTPWSNCISSQGNDYYFGGEFTGVITVADTILTSKGDIDFFIIKTNKNGNILSIIQGGGPGKDRIYDIHNVENGDLYFTGSYSDSMMIGDTISYAKGNADVFIGRLANDRKLKWLKKGGSNIVDQPSLYEYFYDEYGASITVDWKNEIQVAGTTIGSGNFDNIYYNASEDFKQNAFWLSLSDKDTSFILSYPCAVINLPTTSPGKIKIYPNPFSQSLNIQFPQNNFLGSLSLFNLLGQKIESLKIENANLITIKNWNSLPAGMYLLKIENANFHQSFKILKH